MRGIRTASSGEICGYVRTVLAGVDVLGAACALQIEIGKSGIEKVMHGNGEVSDELS